MSYPADNNDNNDNNNNESFEKLRREAKELAATAKGLVEAECHSIGRRLEAAKETTSRMMTQYYDRFEDYAGKKPANKALKFLAFGFAAGWLLGRRKRS